jgi:hypothetical protein
MAVRREDTIPGISGVPAVRIVTLDDDSVLLCQGTAANEMTVTLHKFQAAEIAGFLWPEGMRPVIRKVN